MISSQESRSLIVKIALFAGAALVIFGCGLCLGATVTAILTYQKPFAFSPGSAGSSLDHPAPPGTAVLADDLEIRVTGTVRPADDIVAEGSLLNPRPGPGNEMMLVTVSLTCRLEEKDTCTFIPAMDFLLVSPVAVHRPKWLVTGLPHLLESGEVSAGETVSGDLVFEVAKEETGLVLVYADIFGDRVVYLQVR